MKKSLYLIISLSIFVFSCRAIREIKNLQNCEFSALGIENVVLSGIKMNNKNGVSDFSFTEIARIGQDYAKNKLILTYTIPIQADNPNSQLAALNRIDWKLMLDDLEILNGTSSDRVEIPAQNTTQFPLNVSMNLSDVLSKKSLTELQEIVFNLEDKYKVENRLILKVKPYLKVGSKQVPTPGFFKVKFLKD